MVGAIVSGFIDPPCATTHSCWSLVCVPTLLPHSLVSRFWAASCPCHDFQSGRLPSSFALAAQTGRSCFLLFCAAGRQVYLLEGWNAEDGARKSDDKNSKGRRGGVVRVQKTSSAELGGIRLHSNMMADHSMNAYEPAIVAAARRYKVRRDARPPREKV